MRVIGFYQTLFNRISHGATRLQEILADRVAVSCYGAAAFEEGLVHAVRRSLEFDEAAHRRLHTATLYHSSAENLYGAHLHNTKANSPELELALQEALNKPSTAENTHPSPIERFRLAVRIPFRRTLPADGMVWDLFEDHGQLFSEMTKLAQDEVYHELAEQRAWSQA